MFDPLKFADTLSVPILLFMRWLRKLRASNGLVMFYGVDYTKSVFVIKPPKLAEVKVSDYANV
ncbi:hypothetical protein BCT54_09120 [Vibrio splendidus]|uniref:Uncharacterized protein n=1 Tax=Vibrio splendidus TaxID=29497 RepID=A0A2N7JLA9_VIBSP|nr:hypothetical protein BCT54_09120 [Vibrio splendidus]